MPTLNLQLNDKLDLTRAIDTWLFITETSLKALSEPIINNVSISLKEEAYTYYRKNIFPKYINICEIETQLVKSVIDANTSSLPAKLNESTYREKSNDAYLTLFDSKTKPKTKVDVIENLFNTLYEASSVKDQKVNLVSELYNLEQYDKLFNDLPEDKVARYQLLFLLRKQRICQELKTCIAKNDLPLSDFKTCKSIIDSNADYAIYELIVAANKAHMNKASASNDYIDDKIKYLNDKLDGINTEIHNNNTEYNRGKAENETQEDYEIRLGNNRQIAVHLYELRKQRADLQNEIKSTKISIRFYANWANNNERSAKFVKDSMYYFSENAALNISRFILNGGKLDSENQKEIFKDIWHTAVTSIGVSVVSLFLGPIGGNIVKGFFGALFEKEESKNSTLEDFIKDTTKRFNDIEKSIKDLGRKIDDFEKEMPDILKKAFQEHDLKEGIENVSESLYSIKRAISVIGSPVTNSKPAYRELLKLNEKYLIAFDKLIKMYLGNDKSISYLDNINESDILGEDSFITKFIESNSSKPIFEPMDKIQNLNEAIIKVINDYLILQPKIQEIWALYHGVIPYEDKSISTQKVLFDKINDEIYYNENIESDHNFKVKLQFLASNTIINSSIGLDNILVYDCLRLSKENLSVNALNAFGLAMRDANDASKLIPAKFNLKAKRFEPLEKGFQRFFIFFDNKNEDKYLLNFIDNNLVEFNISLKMVFKSKNIITIIYEDKTTCDLTPISLSKHEMLKESIEYKAFNEIEVFPSQEIDLPVENIKLFFKETWKTTATKIDFFLVNKKTKEQGILITKEINGNNYKYNLKIIDNCIYFIGDRQTGKIETILDLSYALDHSPSTTRFFYAISNKYYVDNRYLFMHLPNIDTSKLIPFQKLYYEGIILAQGSNNKLIFLKDEGNLALYQNNTIVWKSCSINKDGVFAMINDNGYLCIYDDSASILWQCVTKIENGCVKFADDKQLFFYTNDSNKIDFLKTVDNFGNKLPSGRVMYSEFALTNSYEDTTKKRKSEFKLRMQRDGNFVLYSQFESNGKKQDPIPLWATGTNNDKSNHAFLKPDGTFVILDKDANEIHTIISSGKTGAYIELIAEPSGQALNLILRIMEENGKFIKDITKPQVPEYHI